MKTIPLTQGKEALVDDEDYEWLSQWKWCAIREPSSGAFYAVRNSAKMNGKRSNPPIRMHRLILGLVPYDEREVDHKNPSDTLDNRRQNLRICNSAQNKWNSRKRKDNTSGCKGVAYVSKREKWQARIYCNNKMVWLGYHPTKLEAEERYREAASRLHGEFAGSA